jgi:hypothetical protein
MFPLTKNPISFAKKQGNASILLGWSANWGICLLESSIPGAFGNVLSRTGDWRTQDHEFNKTENLALGARHLANKSYCCSSHFRLNATPSKISKFYGDPIWIVRRDSTGIPSHKASHSHK